MIPWERVSLGGHALAVVALQPLVVAALWLTGGADAYLGPMLVLPMLYVAYFFPARYAWPLAALEVATYASPLVTSDRARTTCWCTARSPTRSPTPAWSRRSSSSSAASSRPSATSTGWPAWTR